MSGRLHVFHDMEGHLTTYGPRKPSGEAKKQHGNLFTWAESFVAKLGQTRETVAKIAQGGIFKR